MKNLPSSRPAVPCRYLRSAAHIAPLAAALAFVNVTTAAESASAPDKNLAKSEVVSLQNFVVTGSNIRRLDMEKVVPITVIDPDAMAARHAAMTQAQARLRADLTAARLDALIVIGDDQEELFDHSNMPAIGLFQGASIRNAQGTPAHDAMGRARSRFLEAGGAVEYPCEAGLARHLIEYLQDHDFDIAVSGSIPPGKAEGHAYSYIHKFCMDGPPVPIVPVFLNAYYPPNQPTPRRCHALGAALARAIAAFPGDARVGVMASGGLSHFVVDESFDRDIISALEHQDAEFFRNAPLHKLRSGSSEIRNWICLAGAVETLRLDWVSYVPGYRTPALTGTGLCFASFR